MIGNPLLAWQWPSNLFWLGGCLALLALVGVVAWLSLRYIPNNSVGVVEKLWSASGSVPTGRILALQGEAGYQAELLRGGFHFAYWRWQYRVHKAPLVTIAQGKIGYIYARDGESLPQSQTLGRFVDCDNFQDARAFLTPADNVDPLPSPLHAANRGPRAGQRGRQRAILREGVYAINPALFVVISEDRVFTLPGLQTQQERHVIEQFRQELSARDGFVPLVVGRTMSSHETSDDASHEMVDSIGIVTVHDGPSLNPDEIIAPIVASDPGHPDFHNHFQDAEAFLRAGGRRGRQHQVLTDGTYFINRWFATTEMIPKTVIPIGHVGVVVSYVGQNSRDISGDRFRHGEQVATGDRGVWKSSLGPGKYAFNTYAGQIIIVPTTNFVLHWITGRTETHRYDESLRSIDLVTRDAYEPLLPLSIVVHIDYERAPSVIQRFGDVKKLITQTLDPMLSAYFRDVAHKKTMLSLLHERDDIQREAHNELRNKFHAFDIECVDVLIGKPTHATGDDKIEILLEQLRQRQLSNEQLETYERRKAAAQKLQQLNAAEAEARKQTDLTDAEVQVRIADSIAEAELVRARKRAEQTVVFSDAKLQRARREAEQRVLLAEARSRQQVLLGQGQGQRIAQVGLSEAAVLLRKIASFGDPRLYALQEVAQRLAASQQPLVPERLFVTGGEQGQTTPTTGIVGLLLQLLVAEKSGFAVQDSPELAQLQQFADRLCEQAMRQVNPAEQPSKPL